MVREGLLKILKHRRLVKLFLNLSLKGHNICYQLAGMLSAELEKDGLHPKHRLMKYHDWFMSKLQKDWAVLDIGCGNGALAYDMKSVCRSVVGIDIDPGNIRRAEKQHARPGITYICADALTYPFELKFQAVVLSNVLEHIQFRVEFLKQIFAGQDCESPPVLLLRVPMMTRDWITLYKKEQGIEWRLDHSHFTEYTLEQVFDEVSKAGLVVAEYDIRFGEFYGVVTKD